MVEIVRCGQYFPQSLKEHQKSQTEELQKQYEMDLNLWLKSLWPEQCAVHKSLPLINRI